MRSPSARLGATSLATGFLLVALFVVMVLRFGRELRAEIHLKMVERNASILYPMAQQLLSDSEAAADQLFDDHHHLRAVMRTARQEGVWAMAIFDSDGAVIEKAPGHLQADLSFDDYEQLLESGPISRFHRHFVLDEPAGAERSETTANPVLEVLVPLRSRYVDRVLGFARYYLDARVLSGELAVIDRRIDRQIGGTLAIGCALIIAIVAAAYVSLSRAQRLIAERNERLTRANFELTLAAKASALGQITSHLIHGLQGPVAGLQAAVNNRGEGAAPDWQSAADYAGRLQTLIAETVALLSDMRVQATYEVTLDELASIIQARNLAAAKEKGVTLAVHQTGRAVLDSHRASLLCLIATNLIQNAVAVTPRAGAVNVALECSGAAVTLRVADTGPGIPPDIRERLFQPGRSGRPGGSGLGLAISHLLARQIGAELLLKETGPSGTTFSVTGLVDSQSRDAAAS